MQVSYKFWVVRRRWNGTPPHDCLRANGMRFVDGVGAYTKDEAQQAAAHRNYLRPGQRLDLVECTFEEMIQASKNLARTRNNQIEELKESILT